MPYPPYDSLFGGGAMFVELFDNRSKNIGPWFPPESRHLHYPCPALYFGELVRSMC